MIFLAVREKSKCFKNFFFQMVEKRASANSFSSLHPQQQQCDDLTMRAHLQKYVCLRRTMYSFLHESKLSIFHKILN